MYVGVIVRRTPQSRKQISQADRPAPTSPHPITLTSLNRIDGVTSIGESKTSIWLGPSETGSGTWATVRGMGWGKGGEKGGLSFHHHRHHMPNPFNCRSTRTPPPFLHIIVIICVVHSIVAKPCPPQQRCVR